MNWKFGKEIPDISLVEEFEKLHHVKLDLDFITTVKNSNGGYPEKDTVDTQTSKGKTVQCLLSFGKSDDDNIWAANKDATNVLRFASNDFGGYFAFDSDGRVLFQNHETGETEYVAECFSDFVNRLY
ncbi:hypothetical protein FACS1894216_19300 [Synergistales bacterium]|nr:hypothetical protein FACS1894216_19300 [Synergistales bacterium]